MKGLVGKTALITGASSGIGQAIAIRLAEEGCNIVINYRSNPDAAEDTRRQAMEKACADVENCGVKALLLKGDVSKEADAIALVQQTIEHFGQLDILVNNAGVQADSPSEALESDSFDWVLGVNLRGAYLCARETIKHLLASDRPGSVINISSVHEIIPRPQYLSYSISKGGMGNMTRTLALEYAAKGIRVNGIGPGATVTPINDDWTDDSAKKAEVESHIPMGRAGTSEEMAAAVAFLASDEAAYITGQTLYIDGGLTLYADFREAWSA
ncbi:glucose 1-dehydrogenase [Phormidium tenue]|uniref:Sugar dehydrogenase n=1 Tax=Phormidium tenue NIES-30 TaxID=549789 RepID=A0A1U7J0L5_9CYAN|nr:glucose 1-dehydrogenase [Phormidium tenue]MBD2234161.1 glucose 1-dehydrogenase [Phormidium tenue FACHB-1052]OKH45105.1 sugar dehydrogenase [Phormidium tenue NIES-30]